MKSAVYEHKAKTDMSKRARTLVLILLFLASLSGCAGPGYQRIPDIPGEYGVWYVPEFKAGMTADSAKAALRETLESYRTCLLYTSRCV